MALPNGVDFYVNENRILEPLGLVVLRDSRVDLFPRVKERIEEIPGRHSEIDFGSKFEPRILELHVTVSEEFSLAEREKRKREIARHLNHTMGTKILVFADEPDKQYFVKYSGIVDITRQYTSWFEFTIPFKCSDPYIYGKEREEEFVVTQSPKELNIFSKGNMEAYPTIVLLNKGGNTVNGFIIQYYEEIIEVGG